MTLLAVAGVVAVAVVMERRPKAPNSPDLSLVLLLLVIELRSGLSVLAAMGRVSAALPEDVVLARVYRTALVSGLTKALAQADNRLRPVVAQLARSQRSGSSLSAAVRNMIDSNLASERTSRIARARTLPVKLMLPVTLLMLPGLVLMLYAPSLLSMFEDLTGGLT